MVASPNLPCLAMSLNSFSKTELLEKCAELGISKCASKTKRELVDLIQLKNNATKLTKGSAVTQALRNEATAICDTSVFALVDLFCGTGAFSKAFHATGRVVTVFANDMLDSSEAIFNLNHAPAVLTKQNLIDVPNDAIPACDILTAGFPCQPFSIAGKQMGFDDERSNVFWKILSILEHHAPRIVVLENVKNLQSHENGNTFKTIVENLEARHYHLKHAILNTSKITGIPQNRERIYIVCFKDPDLCERFNFDFPEVPLRPVAEFLQGYHPGTGFAKDVDDKYYYLPSSPIYDKLKEGVTKHVLTNTIYQYRRYYVRENKNNVCPTLTANMGSGGHNVPILLDDHGIRKLTPRECFNLQGFDSDYQLPPLSASKLYSLAGNAVSMPVVSLIANKIVELLD